MAHATACIDECFLMAPPLSGVARDRRAAHRNLPPRYTLGRRAIAYTGIARNSTYAANATKALGEPNVFD
jgi:hypothetical protein